MSVKKDEQRALLTQNDRDLDDVYHSYAMNHGLSDAAFWLLYILWDGGDGVTQCDICDLWCFSRQTINTALKGLAKQGIIRLEPMANNRKSKRIRLTDEGRIYTQNVIQPFIDAENAVFTSLSEREQQLLLDVSKKRVTTLRKELQLTE